MPTVLSQVPAGKLDAAKDVHITRKRSAPIVSPLREIALEFVWPIKVSGL